MNTLLISLLSTIILGGYPQDNNIPSDVYADYLPIVDQAVYKCRYAKPEKVNVKLLWDLVKIEVKYNPPSQLKGMLLAAACHESGYNPNVTRQLKSVKKKCRFRSQKKLWIAAWVTSIRYPKASGRCYEKPLHLRILKKWKRNIKKNSKLTGC